MSARRSLYLASATAYGGFALGLIGTVVLARLLTPAEIGTFSIAASFATLVAAFRELGVGNYVVQEPELTVDRVRAAFAVALGMSWLFAAGLAASSVWLSELYANPEMTHLVLLGALNFVLIPFGSITVAVLRRRLEFGKLMVISLGSAVIGLATSIVLAVRGWGSLGLAVGGTVGVAATVLLAQPFRPRDMPLLPGVRELRRVLGFGFAVTTGSAAGSAAEASRDLIIGKMLGAAETGIFNKAIGLADGFVKIILQPVWSFALPHFAAEIRSGGDISSVYLRAVSLLCGIGWPFLAIIAITAERLVDFLLGPQWTAAVPIAKIICLGMIPGVMIAPFGSILLAKSLAADYVRFMSLTLLVTIIVLISLAPFGLIAVAVAHSLSGLLLVMVALLMLKRRFGIGLRAQGKAVVSSAAVAILVTGIGYVAWLSIEHAGWSSFTSLAVMAPTAIGCWLGAIWLLHPPLRHELTLAGRQLGRVVWRF